MLAIISTTLGYRVLNLWVKNMHDFITKMNMLDENLSNLYIDFRGAGPTKIESDLKFLESFGLRVL